MSEYSRFDFEQQIMTCWNVTEELDTLYKATLDTNITKEEIANILLGLHGLYEIKFNNLFAQFEQSGEHYNPEKNIEVKGAGEHYREFLAKSVSIRNAAITKGED